jgi:ABC-2 type transport system ATP-binding protein
MNVIETDQLTKNYGKSRGVTNLSFSIEEGEIYGFIGPNGAGKSTTIRLLLSLLFPTSGSGKIFSYDIVRNGRRIKRHVGFVPSEIHYYEKMTVKQLLEYSLRFYNMKPDNDFSRLIEILNLDLSRKIEDLSMGNKKKLAIIQSLLHKPRLLILDEPTSGLDPLMQNRFFEILKEVNKNGVTIFFSSHVLSEVEKICHRVAIIKEGIIINEDNISSLKKNLLSRITYQLKTGIENIPIHNPGIISKETDHNVVSFLYKGDISELLKDLAVLPIEKINITEPDLEEIFMHFYQNGNGEDK